MASNLTLRKKSTLWFFVKNVQKTQKSSKMRKVRSLFSHFQNHNNAPDIFNHFSVLNVTFTHFFEAVKLQYTILTIFRPIKLAKTCQPQSTGILAFLRVGNFGNEKCAKHVCKNTGHFLRVFYVQNVFITPLYGLRAFLHFAKFDFEPLGVYDQNYEFFQGIIPDNFGSGSNFVLLAAILKTRKYVIFVFFVIKMGTNCGRFWPFWDLAISGLIFLSF